MDGSVLTIIGFALVFMATAFGAGLVFFFNKDVSEKGNKLFLGFASGIMIAASVWSLLLPAIESSERLGAFSFLPATLGLILGGVFLALLDRVLPDSFLGGHLYSQKKSMKLFVAMTAHNIPEGLAVGFAFGGAAMIGTTEAFAMAMGLAVGIAVQNFPEGAAVSLPLKSAMGTKKAFLFGAGSGIVEPIAAAFGYFLATAIEFLQPYFLSFAAGAMIFVVAEDLIPESSDNSSKAGAWGVLIGFALMMALDVALG